MNRSEFTHKISSLILDMISLGERPLIDEVKRSKEEQKRMYDKKLSKLTGEPGSISQHQLGRACDIYFLSEDGTKLVDPIYGHEHWHKVWELKYGGNVMISWDKGHFEVT